MPRPLDAKKVECIERLAASGEPYREIARRCGVSVKHCAQVRFAGSGAMLGVPGKGG